MFKKVVDVHFLCFIIIIMIDLIKKGFMAGIGATVVTKEAIESALNDLVEKGKISAADAKETADKIAEEGKKEFENTREDLNSMFNELLKRANLVTQEQFLELETRIAALERHNSNPSSPDTQ